MKAKLITRLLAAAALTGSLFGIIWTQQARATASTQQPPAGKAEKEEKEEDEEGDEQTIKLNEAPKEVQAAINKITGGKNIKAIIHEGDAFEVEYEANGKAASADISAAGDIMAMESVIDAGALPKAVTAAIAKAHPNSTIKTAESVQEFFYELVVVADGKPHAVKVTAAGKIEHAEGAEEDEKDEDKD